MDKCKNENRCNSQICDMDNCANYEPMLQDPVLICEDLLIDVPNVMDGKGYTYTEEALRALDGLEDVVVFDNFSKEKPIGLADIKYIDRLGLVATIFSHDRKIFEGFQVAPRYRFFSINVERESDLRIIDRVELRALALTHKHSIVDMPKIKEGVYNG